MASINQATVVGFLGEEPKVSTTQTGRKVASFSVATTEKGYTAQNGTQYPDKTEWHNVVIWGKLAEVAEKYLHKGSSVYIQGKMRTRSYEDKNQIKRYITEIECDVMQMLDRRDLAQGMQNNGYSQGSYQDAAQNYFSSKQNNDLPF